LHACFAPTSLRPRGFILFDHRLRQDNNNFWRQHCGLEYLDGLRGGNLRRDGIDPRRE